jgi:uncharacterized protein involved in exopolysaccharide biosynthesis
MVMVVMVVMVCVAACLALKSATPRFKSDGSC